MIGTRNKKVISWWSGGITSAVACKLALDFFDDVSIVFMDTKNEDEDTYRFKADCEKWYGQKIDTISRIARDKYNSIEDVWEKYKSLNVATGAICSAVLKRELRIEYQKSVEYDYQVFGFEFDKKEMNRALSIQKNYPNSKPIFPLLMMGYDKSQCIKIVSDAGISPPRSYAMGFNNNNCLNTGCVQGGIGYWQKMKKDFPDKFYKMAEREHKLTKLKGKPVTMLKDQSKEAKKSGNELVFLVKHPDYPELKCIDDMKARPVKPITDCNGFCGTNDLNKRSETEKEINYEKD